MATFNGEKYIKQQLDSILAQSYQDFELIICDDCSSDKTVEIINDYSDSRIKLYENKQNLGFKNNFQKAVSLCSKDYIAFCDQDDIWTSDHLEFLLSNIGSCDLICANAKMIDSNGKDMNATTKNCLGDFFFPQNKSDLFKKLLHGNFVQGTASLITKKLADKVFPIPENIDFHDWWAASVSCLNNGCNYKDKIILLYRQHENNVTTNKKIDFIDSIKNAIQNRKNKYIEYSKKAVYAAEILKLCETEQESTAAKASKEYYDNLSHKRFLKSIKYFINNYQDIFWVRNPSKKVFLLRFCKVFIFHI